MSRSVSLRKGRHEFPYHCAIEAYGVRIGVSANTPAALRSVEKRIAEVLPEFEVIAPTAPIDHRLLYVWNPSGRDSSYKNGETIDAGRKRSVVIDRFGSAIRLTAAEFAVGRVFIHAGAVGWKGKVLIFPAQSFEGKSTLTAELVRRGAEYFSDEYAILDPEGLVYPFPKRLSIRGEKGKYVQVDYPVESFGGTAADRPLPAGMILLTRFIENARWAPKVLTPAKGILETLNHTLPTRRDPQFTLATLRHFAENGVIARSNRGNVGTAAGQIIEYFERMCL